MQSVAATTVCGYCCSTLVDVIFLYVPRLNVKLTDSSTVEQWIEPLPHCGTEFDSTIRLGPLCWGSLWLLWLSLAVQRHEVSGVWLIDYLILHTVVKTCLSLRGVHKDRPGCLLHDDRWDRLQPSLRL